MMKTIEIDISEEWGHFRCGRCTTRFKVWYEGETPDERRERIRRREDRRKAKELYGKLLGLQRKEAIS